MIRSVSILMSRGFLVIISSRVMLLISRFVLIRFLSISTMSLWVWSQILRKNATNSQMNSQHNQILMNSFFSQTGAYSWYSWCLFLILQAPIPDAYSDILGANLTTVIDCPFTWQQSNAVNPYPSPKKDDVATLKPSLFCKCHVPKEKVILASDTKRA